MEELLKDLTTEDDQGQALVLRSKIVAPWIPFELRSQHRAAEQRCVQEFLVDMVGDEGSATTVTVPSAIPPGAYNVVISGLVIVEIEGDEGITGISLGVDGPGGFSADVFAEGVALTVGTKLGIADRDGSVSTMFPEGADLVFTVSDDDDLEITAGQIRLAVFYSILTAPTS